MRNIFGYMVWSASQWSKDTWLVIICLLVVLFSAILQQAYIMMTAAILIPLIGLGSIVREKVSKGYIKYKRIKEASKDCPL